MNSKVQKNTHKPLKSFVAYTERQEISPSSHHHHQQQQ